jgi:hypothetical protein
MQDQAQGLLVHWTVAPASALEQAVEGEGPGFQGLEGRLQSFVMRHRRR